jgi:methionyl-tRNA synthetase
VHRGWFSVSDEAFVPESQVTEKTLSDGSTVKTSCETGHVLEWIEEENYKFRLSSFQKSLLQWITTHSKGLEFVLDDLQHA